MGKWGKFVQLLTTYEWIIFAIVVLLNCSPILATKYMLSLDGSSHVYNATLINHLLFSDKTVIHDFFEFNHIISPNWSGHVLMSIFQWFVSPVMSEKLLIIFILIFTPYSFRYLLKSFEKPQIIGSYIAIVFTYSNFQAMGFYNFLISLIPFFYLLGYFIRKSHDLKWKNYLIISLLLLVVFFSHAFVFLLSLFTIGLLVFFSTLNGAQSFKQWFYQSIPKIWPMIMVILPSTLLFWQFIEHKPPLKGTYLKTDEIIDLFTGNLSLVSLSHEERKFTQPILIVLGILLLLAIVYRIKEIRQHKKSSFTDVFLILIISHVFFVLYLPDTDGWGGYYTLRSLLLLNILAAVFAMAVRMPVSVKFGLILIALFFQARRLKLEYRLYREQQPVIEFIEQAGNRIERNALVTSVNIGYNWMLGHVGARLATQNKAIAVDNYEMTINYFPLAWKLSTMPEPVVPDTMVPNRVRHWPHFESNYKKQNIDYIFVIGEFTKQVDPDIKLLEHIVSKNYTPVLSKNDMVLYKLKQKESSLN